MQQNDRVNTSEEKRLAKKMYAERKIKEWVVWSFTVRGKVLWKELMEIQKEYKLYN